MLALSLPGVQQSLLPWPKPRHEASLSMNPLFRSVKTRALLIAAGWALLAAGCSSAPPPTAERPAGYKIYITNEASGELSIIDSATNDLSATIMLGKRPRG